MCQKYLCVRVSCITLSKSYLNEGTEFVNAILVISTDASATVFFRFVWPSPKLGLGVLEKPPHTRKSAADPPGSCIIVMVRRVWGGKFVHVVLVSIGYWWLCRPLHWHIFQYSLRCLNCRCHGMYFSFYHIYQNSLRCRNCRCHGNYCSFYRFHHYCLGRCYLVHCNSCFGLFL